MGICYSTAPAPNKGLELVDEVDEVDGVQETREERTETIESTASTSASRSNTDKKSIGNDDDDDDIKALIANHQKASELQLKNEDDDKFAVDIYTMGDVWKHNCLENGIWIVIDDMVYNITSFIVNNLHPASNNFIIPYYGKDATEAFEATNHSGDARKLLSKYEIGELSEKDKEENALKKSPNLERDISLAPNLDQFKQSSLLDNICITKLYIYPVKGCGGYQVNEAILTKDGFLHDRIYGFYNTQNNKIINQLTYRQLALIRVRDVSSDGIYINDKFIPYIKTRSLMVTWKACSTPIQVWDQGDEIAEWGTNFINSFNSGSTDSFRFVRITSENYRETEEYFSLSFAPRSKQLMNGFQNYGAVLLGSSESLDELNKRYAAKDERGELLEDEEKSIDWDRFRMNIVISGLPIPHYEDFLKHLVFGEKYSDNTRPAEILWSRRRYFCAVPQVNQKKGTQSAEPINTAQRYRNAITLNDRTALPGDNGVFFGSFYCIKHSGKLIVGQCVNVEHSELDYNTLRTTRGKSYYGLNDRNIGSQFAVDYHSEYQQFKLIKKEYYNADTMKFKFELIDANDAKNKYHRTLKETLKLGDHYLLKFIDNNKNIIIRAYTPVFDDSNGNEMCFDLLVKIYQNGKMSQHLKNMKINQLISAKQDYGKVCYYEIGKIRFGDPRFTMFLPYNRDINKINLIAGGSGITPIYQILTNINLNKEIDTTQINVIYANKTMKDILLRKELEIINKSNKNINFKFVISRPNKNNKNERRELIENKIDIGRISKDICIKNLFKPNQKCITLICGPHPMEQSVIKFLHQIGHDEKSIASF